MNQDIAAQIEQSFLRAYVFRSAKATAVPDGFLRNAPGSRELFSLANAATFGGGVYRLHDLNEVARWTSIARQTFPDFADRIIECFAFDWLGRQFALDAAREFEGSPAVLMLEPGTGRVLEIPANFLSFHCRELIDHADAALAKHAFEAWQLRQLSPLGHSECLGYKIPLYLGGEDDISNLELIDMEVYWDLNAQMTAQVL